MEIEHPRCLNSANATFYLYIPVPRFGLRISGAICIQSNQIKVLRSSAQHCKEWENRFFLGFFAFMVQNKTKHQQKESKNFCEPRVSIFNTIS